MRMVTDICMNITNHGNIMIDFVTTLQLHIDTCVRKARL